MINLWYALAAVLAVFLLITASCQQYDYISPSPGTIEVRLQTISSKIAFSPLNNFILRVKSVEGIRPNSSRVLVFEDLRAKGRTSSKYNTLDFRAQDASLVIGQGYAPPDDYLGVDLTVEPGDTVVLNGYQFIRVDRPEGFKPLLQFRRPFKVSESRSTTIVLTINLDSSLVQGASTYQFRPYYYISSISQ